MLYKLMICKKSIFKTPRNFKTSCLCKKKAKKFPYIHSEMKNVVLAIGLIYLYVCDANLKLFVLSKMIKIFYRSSYGVLSRVYIYLIANRTYDEKA